MKAVNARDLQKRIKECVDMSQQDQVVITRSGKPAAVMFGVEGKGCSVSDLFKLLEAYRGEEKGVYDVDKLLRSYCCLLSRGSCLFVIDTFSRWRYFSRKRLSVFQISDSEIGVHKRGMVGAVATVFS